MACDPSWKTDNGFRSNYMSELHRRILVKRPTFSKKVSPRIESKVKWLKTKFHVINDMLKYSGCQWNDVDNKITCERDWYFNYCENHKEANGLRDSDMENEQNGESGGDNVGGFHLSLSDDEERFNANFGTMENDVANAMTDDNNRKKAKSEQLKDVLVELTKLDISSGNVLHAAEIFAANKDKLDLFLNLPHQLRVSYVHKLTGLSSD
ncbi:hypothetical protein Tco_0762046 [Tanacetum coccineum]